MIEITERQIDRVSLILDGLKNMPETALANVINRALTTARSESDKGIRQTYSIRQADLKNNRNISVKNAGRSDVEGSLSYAGNLIPLIKFNPGLEGLTRRQKVQARQLTRNPPTTFKDAFVARMSNGHVGIFERKGKERFPIKEIMGSSIAHMVENDDVWPAVEAAAQDTIDKRVEQEITRILNGYGGRR
ncbi:MAG: phage tail protein [Oscillospiraceae bacterium]|nr:phage tail protein [Oscillospiraceae bacterium]